MSDMTTARRGMFRVEDVSFRNPRKQSEVAKEIAAERGISEQSISAPVSLTPEQVKAFYAAKRAETYDTNEKRVYDLTIKWIDELFVFKKQKTAEELAQMRAGGTDDGYAEDTL